MGRTDLAIKDLEDAIAVHPSPLKYAHLAQADLMARRRKEATVALQNAKRARLTTDTLSPLERETCRRLLAELVPERSSRSVFDVRRGLGPLERKNKKSSRVQGDFLAPQNCRFYVGL